MINDINKYKLKMKGNIDSEKSSLKIKGLSTENYGRIRSNYFL